MYYYYYVLVSYMHTILCNDSRNIIYLSVLKEISLEEVGLTLNGEYICISYDIYYLKFNFCFFHNILKILPICTSIYCSFFAVNRE